MERMSLVEALAAVPDPRKRRGVRHPLTAVLSLTAVAILAGCKSREAIAQFGRDHGTALTHALGFTRGDCPTKSCLGKIFRRLDVGALFRRLDVGALEAALARWVLSRERDGWPAVAIDGMTRRGSADGDAPGVHLLSAYVPAAAAVIAPMRVDAKTNEHKAALKRLGVLPLKGKVVTGDALFTHRDVAGPVVQAEGDSIRIVKDNQAELKGQIFSALHGDGDFSPYQRKQKEKLEQPAQSINKGHGRRETRRMLSTTALHDYLDWPGVAQLFEQERVRVLKDTTEVEVVYGITSLTRERADGERLLGRVRGHWGMENGAHQVRAVTLGEDACRVRKGRAAGAGGVA